MTATAKGTDVDQEASGVLPLVTESEPSMERHAPSQAAQKDLNQIVTLLWEGQLEEAVVLLDSRMQATPEHVAHWIILGRLLEARSKELEQLIEERLQEYGNAPVAAYRIALATLDFSRGSAFAGIDPAKNGPEPTGIDPVPAISAQKTVKNGNPDQTEPQESRHQALERFLDLLIASAAAIPTTSKPQISDVDQQSDDLYKDNVFNALLRFQTALCRHVEPNAPPAMLTRRPAVGKEAILQVLRAFLGAFQGIRQQNRCKMMQNLENMHYTLVKLRRERT
ncbi:MAG: hypothetical protein HQL50_16040 [Magnetococcales bacterium]|nr:hypothetical protein [Magnetococcales bacterium]